MKYTKKLLAVILAVICVSSAGSINVLADEPSTTEPTTVNDIYTPDEPSADDEKAKEEAKKTLEEQRADIEKKLKESEKKLKEFGDSAEMTEEYINALDEKIGYLNEELNLLDKEIAEANKKIEELDKQIEPLEEQIELLQEQYDESKKECERLTDNFQITYQAYCLRLRAMYISGNASIIVALLTSEDISQFLNRFEMIKAVSKSDAELLEQINLQIEEIITKQDGLNEKKDKLTAAQKQLDDKKSEYEKQQEAVNSKQLEIANKKLILADERAKSDELFADYAKQNKIYLDYAEDSDEALDALDEEIEALLSGRKSPDEVTTAADPKLKDKDSVDAGSQTGDVFSGSDAALSLTNPVPGHTTLSQGFGNIRGGKAHTGIDIPCPTGSNVVAAQKGIVTRVKRLNYSYGYYVMIYHGTDSRGRKIVTLYAHNSSILVSVGQSVTKGQTIAKSGSTGNSTGPHCHFEVIIDGTQVNPKNYIG